MLPDGRNRFPRSANIFFNRLFADLYLCLKGPYHAERFQISPHVKQVVQQLRGRCEYIQIPGVANLPSSLDSSLDLYEVTNVTLAMAILVTSSASTHSAVIVARDFWQP